MILTKARNDDNSPADSFNRSERIFFGECGYCYKTRGGEVIGTFATEAEAKYNMNRFIELAILEKEFKSNDMVSIGKLS